MSQLMFDGLGVSLDSQTVQSLLESQGLSSEALGTSSIMLDDEDLIQCGKCKKQFNSLSLFISHKEEHRLGYALSRFTSDIDDQLTADHLSSIHMQSLDSNTPIIVEDGTNILSFSIDQNGSFITTSRDTLSALGQPIILTSTQLVNDSELLNDDDNLAMDQDLPDIPVQQMLETDPDDPGEEFQLSIPDSLKTPEKVTKLKCEFCNKKFAKNFDLQQHIRSHTGEKPFQCVVCGRAFSQKSNVKKHMTTHKVWPEGMSRTLPKDPLLLLQEEENDNSSTTMFVDRSYVCQYCSSTFDSYFQLKTHMKSHVARKVYKCIQKNCSQTFDDLDAFLQHSRSHPNKVQFRCHICNKQFLTLADLGLHQYSHNKRSKSGKNSQKVFRCLQCKSRFMTPESLDHHKQTTNHHYTCTSCDKVFPCERYLRRHLLTHGASSSFTCELCGKGFRTEQYLNAHRVIHSSEKPYTCEHCPAAFNRRDKLARHTLIHLPFKKLKCPFRNYLGCTKEFNRQDKLKAHMLTHSNQKSFSCGSCNRSFQRMSLLRSHEKQHRKALVCSKCCSAYKTKAQLATHRCQEVTKKGRSRRKQPESLDNVPTIEIIVMPVSRSDGQPCSSSGMYQVTFPSATTSEADQSSPEQQVPV